MTTPIFKPAAHGAAPTQAAPAPAPTLVRGDFIADHAIAPLVLVAENRYEQPGHYRVAARVTDVFGNDGIATVTVEVK